MFRLLFAPLAVVLLLLGWGAAADAFKPFRFAAVADPHISLATRNSPENGGKMFKASEALLRAALQDIGGRGVDFVVVLGDLTRDAEPWNMDRFMEIMEDCEHPWYAVLGNHDHSPADTRARDMDPGMSRSSVIWALQGHGFDGPGRHWSVRLDQGITMLGVDSTEVGNWRGRLTPSALRFLRSELAKGEGEPVIVLSHHMLAGPQPLLDGQYLMPTVANQAETRSILADYDGPVLALSGHLHIGTRLIQDLAPADNLLSFSLVPTVSWPMGYTVFEVRPEGVAWQVYDLPVEAAVVEEAKGHTRKWVLGRWRTRKPDESDEQLWERASRMLLAPEYRRGSVPWPAD